jgi:hypothetical protein
VYDELLENYPMTKILAGASVTCVVALLNASLVFSAEQLSPGTPPKTTEQKQTPKAAPDNWVKMKDCAEQAVKALAERDRRIVLLGGHASDGWSNHYSPKYNRCVLKAEYIAASKDMKGGPFLNIILIDAFELANLTTAKSGPSAEVLCSYEQDPKGCERVAASFWACDIEGEKSDCLKATQFIDEHMKD